MKITFDEKNHVYTVNGDIANISVTELLAKHGLAPDYSAVKSPILKAAAQLGKEIHKDLESVLNVKNYEPTTGEGKNYAAWVQENIDAGVAEFMLGIVWNADLTVAGTADVVAFMKDGTPILADHKTTINVYKEYVSWQLSLLDFMARKASGDILNDKPFNWRGAEKLLCLHFDKNTHEFAVIEIARVPDEEITRLFEAEAKGERYQRPVLVIDNELQEAVEKAELALLEAKRQSDAAEKNAKALREQLCELFEKQGIKSWESPNRLIKVTYVGASESISVDSVKLKKTYPKIWEECQKLVKKKAYVKITEIDDEET